MLLPLDLGERTHWFSSKDEGRGALFGELIAGVLRIALDLDFGL